jgi:hypothetical protein
VTAASFVEGLLGFQFNVVSSNIGTRRPLIIQMINNPEKHDPSCRFLSESVPESGAAAASGFSAGDLEEETSVGNLAQEIQRRTNAVAGEAKNKVSATPIILRVEFKDCANLTVYDTPGIRLAGNPTLAKDIENTVTSLMKPPNRIIVCLEKASTEWVNSISRPFVERVDPQFRRTIIVITKFDNRIKELTSADEANEYLAGEGLPAGCRPFFISMPVKRDLSDSKSFIKSITETNATTFEALVQLGFDKERFAPEIGFAHCKTFLERLLYQKYVESVASTLEVLERTCAKLDDELDSLHAELAELDDGISKKASSYVSLFCSSVGQLLSGTMYCDLAEWGQNLAEERDASGVAFWPNEEIMQNMSEDIEGWKLKLSGNAQISRLLMEFQSSFHSNTYSIRIHMLSIF